MMRLSSVVGVFALLTPIGAWKEEADMDLSGVVISLLSDDECSLYGAEACAFNALQHRGQVRTAEALEALAASGEDSEREEIEHIPHYALNCWKPCGEKEGFCEDYCGAGNACCKHGSRTTPECEEAKFFPVLHIHTCVHTKLAPPTAGAAAGGSCTDQESSCAGWAKNGECEKNPNYMNVKCCSSCKAGAPAGAAGAECKDSNPSCAAWAMGGECVKNPKWMTLNCRASCQAC